MSGHDSLPPRRIPKRPGPGLQQPKSPLHACTRDLSCSPAVGRRARAHRPWATDRRSMTYKLLSPRLCTATILTLAPVRKQFAACPHTNSGRQGAGAVAGYAAATEGVGARSPTCDGNKILLSALSQHGYKRPRKQGSGLGFCGKTVGPFSLSQAQYRMQLQSMDHIYGHTSHQPSYSHIQHMPIT